jgi:hypothetical protein
MKKLFVISLLLLVVALSAAPEEDLFPLIGTWVNPEYNSTEGSPKLVYMADEIGESYGTTYAEKPTYVWTYMVEKAWRGADGIITDTPDQLIEVLEESEAD